MSVFYTQPDMDLWYASVSASRVQETASDGPVIPLLHLMTQLIAGVHWNGLGDKVDSMNHVAAAIAAKRLTRLVVDDKITEDLREAWFDKFPPETTKLGYLVSCKKCTSFWASAVTIALSYSTAARPLVYALALSEIVILADRFEDRFLAEETDMMGFN